MQLIITFIIPVKNEAALNDGCDLFSFWKKTRQDTISKILPSKLFNSFTSYAMEFSKNE